MMLAKSDSTTLMAPVHTIWSDYFDCVLSHTWKSHQMGLRNKRQSKNMNLQWPHDLLALILISWKTVKSSFSFPFTLFLPFFFFLTSAEFCALIRPSFFQLFYQYGICSDCSQGKVRILYYNLPGPPAYLFSWHTCPLQQTKTHNELSLLSFLLLSPNDSVCLEYPSSG